MSSAPDSVALPDRPRERLLASGPRARSAAERVALVPVALLPAAGMVTGGHRIGPAAGPQDARGAEARP